MQLLNTLVEQLEVSAETADAAKHKYAQLHAALMAAMSRERKLLDDAKALKKQMDVGINQWEFILEHKMITNANVLKEHIKVHAGTWVTDLV